MSSVLLHQHLGLGDHLMCHGIVREYCKNYDRVGMFCKSQNLPSVAFMFRDLKNLSIIPIERDQDAFRTIFWNKFTFGKRRWNKVVEIGFENLNRTSGEQLEQQFYRAAGIPFEKKWESFHINRDSVREKALEEKLRTPAEYVFVHDDNRYPIADARITSSLPRVRPQRGLTDNIFDYCGVIERAKEIHAIDSSFMFLIDCLPCKAPNQKLFIHRYARPDNADWQLPILKKNWTILTR